MRKVAEVRGVTAALAPARYLPSGRAADIAYPSNMAVTALARSLAGGWCWSAQARTGREYGCAGTAAVYGGAVRPIMLLAAVLAAEGVSFVLVGSAALYLHGDRVPVRDIDAVPDPGEANLAALHAALGVLIVRGTGTVTAVAGHCGDAVCPHRVWSPGLSARPGRRDWDRLREHAQLFPVSGAAVTVASPPTRAPCGADSRGGTVSDRSGVASVELAVLEVLDAAVSGRPRAHARSAKALAGIDERLGLGPRYAYGLLLDLARPWVIPVRPSPCRATGGPELSRRRRTRVHRVPPFPCWPARPRRRNPPAGSGSGRTDQRHHLPGRHPAVAGTTPGPGRTATAPGRPAGP